MAQFRDWISRMFASGAPRGLSGDTEEIVLGDPTDTFFNPRLRRHQTEGDVVADPALLWSCRSSSGRRCGLATHLRDQKGDGIASFTDVLIILSERDFRRTFERVLEPWTDEASRGLAQAFKAFCDEEGFEMLYADRRYRFGFIQDGGEEMNSHSLGLTPGEFVTALLPNYHSGPIVSSRPVIGVHLNIPGAWEGYREVGTLYSDQVMFTVGNHWMDNFSHRDLKIPALYRLQRYQDGTFVHIINPDCEDTYRVSSDEAYGGPSVLTLSKRDGSPVAYLVLAVMDTFVGNPGPPRSEVQVEAEAAYWKQESAPVSREPVSREPVSREPVSREPVSREPVSRRPSTAPPALGQMSGHKTIVPETLRERLFTLRERGALLQKVHFSRFMRGYDVYLTSSGNISTSSRDRAATFQVRSNVVKLIVHDKALLLNGRPADLGRPLDLGPGVTLELNNNRLEYRDLSGVRASGWPYLGEIRRPTASMHLVFGGRYRIGRERRCKVQLPDEPQNDNIAWRKEVESGAMIRTRSGEIPKSRFYTDSIMVSSEHAELDLRSEPVLHCVARHCYVFVRRGADVTPLFPTQGRNGSRQTRLSAGDEILVGNCLFEVEFPPAAEESAPEPLTPSALAEAAGHDTYAHAPRMPVEPVAAAPQSIPRSSSPGPQYHQPTPPPRPSSDPSSVPAAAGMGERGPAPKRPELRVGHDSILGTPKPEPPPGVNLDFGADMPAARGLGETGPAPSPPKLQRQVYDSVLGLDAPEPAAVNAPGHRQVVVIDEDTWQLELARPGQLRQIGWMVSGEVTVTNHSSGAVAVPEARAESDQRFSPKDYISLKVRGRRGSVRLLDSREARLFQRNIPVSHSTDLNDVRFEIIRRDIEGEEDFSIDLSLAVDRSLPDPRARLLSILLEDRLVEALFTLGLPLHSDRQLTLGALTVTANFDGARLVLRDYLSTYQLPEGGFRPFFYQSSGGSFRTVPEDGRPLSLEPGARLIVESAVYSFSVT